MYFLNQEERKQLARFYLPRAREAGVAEELRGWHWDQPPLQPIYDVRLGVFDVAGQYCPQGRDLFFRRVEHRQGQATKDMLMGRLYHALIAKVITLAKGYIYGQGIEKIAGFKVDVVQEGLLWLDGQMGLIFGLVNEDWKEEARKQGIELLEFEVERLWAQVQEVLLHQPYVQEDSLVSLAVPVVVEQKLNGSFLGLSNMLSTDALTYSEPVVVDMKFGPRRDFHRLATTGYALVLEALHDFPVNIGCIVYAQYKQGRWQIERDIHVIGDELRQRFIEERDDKMRMVYEEIDPGPQVNCKIDCAFVEDCVS